MLSKTQNNIIKLQKKIYKSVSFVKLQLLLAIVIISLSCHHQVRKNKIEIAEKWK